MAGERDRSRPDEDEQREIDEMLERDPHFHKGEPSMPEGEYEVTLPGKFLRARDRPPEPRAGEIRLWLDDDLEYRSAPEGWLHVTTAHEAIRVLDTGNVIELSLDHDLGDDDRFGRGIDVVDFIIERQELAGRDLWPRDGITLHTANAYGRDAMARAIRRYASKLHEVDEVLSPGGHPGFRFGPRPPR
jgi:hypothetical protein